MAGGGANSSGTPSTPGPQSHIHLPLGGSKQAPPKFKGHHRDLDRFIERYDHVCSQYNVTESEQKCRGVINYCSDEVIEIIENTDAYQKKDYAALITALQWFFDGERHLSEFHLGDLEDFTRTWRKQETVSLEDFKQYHREFVRVAGMLKTAGTIEDKAFNKYFWAGLHPLTRRNLEARIMDEEPGFNMRSPFSVDQIIKAAKHIFDRNRFDKDIMEEERFQSRESSGKETVHPCRPRDKVRAKVNDESESEEEEPAPRWKPPRPLEKPRIVTPARKVEKPKEKAPTDDVTELVRGLERLQISQPEYRAYLTRLQLIAPQCARWYPEPTVVPPRNDYIQRARFEEPPRPRYSGPPPARYNEAPRTRFNDQERPRYEVGERPRKEPPPHHTNMSESRTDGRQIFICFGCGAQGHRLHECGTIEKYVDQGLIRRIEGRLRWADKSPIYKSEINETWESAIRRGIENREDKGRQSQGRAPEEKGVYYVNVVQEDSDADSDDQAEFGWESRVAPISHPKTFAADRPSRISKEVRQKSQRDVPAYPHRVREFPLRRNVDENSREKHSIPGDRHFDRPKERPRATTPKAPINITPKRTKGENGIEVVPMDVEEAVLDEPVNHKRKVELREPKAGLRDISNAGPIKGKVQRRVVDEVFNAPLTIPMHQLVALSPALRRDLVKALRTTRDDIPVDVDTPPAEVRREPSKDKGKEKEVLRVETGVEKEEGIPMSKAEVKERTKLLKLKATIGQAVMKGVVDSGSTANIISAKMAERTGLPIVPLGKQSFPVLGVGGPTVRCDYWIPNAPIYVTDSKLLTYGDLFVVEKVRIKLLYGRPWMVANQSGIQEKERGQ
jgi:hypothetical protein